MFEKEFPVSSKFWWERNHIPGELTMEAINRAITCTTQFQIQFVLQLHKNAPSTAVQLYLFRNFKLLDI